MASLSADCVWQEGSAVGYYRIGTEVILLANFDKLIRDLKSTLVTARGTNPVIIFTILSFRHDISHLQTAVKCFCLCYYIARYALGRTCSKNGRIPL